MLYEQLEKEKQKLMDLIEKAIKNGISLSQDKDVMAQNLIVDTLVVQIQKAYEFQPRKRNHQEH